MLGTAEDLVYVAGPDTQQRVLQEARYGLIEPARYRTGMKVRRSGSLRW